MSGAPSTEFIDQMAEKLSDCFDSKEDAVRRMRLATWEVHTERAKRVEAPTIREQLDKQLGFHGRNYGLTVLLDPDQPHKWCADSELWAYAVRKAWDMTDMCSIFHEQWSLVWESVDTDLVMTDREKKLLDELPDEVTLYRGFCGKHGTPTGLSWTPNRDFAVFFSNYRSSDPQVVEKEIHKFSIHCLLEGRDGLEAIVLDV